MLKFKWNFFNWGVDSEFIEEIFQNIHQLEVLLVLEFSKICPSKSLKSAWILLLLHCTNPVKINE